MIGTLIRHSLRKMKSQIFYTLINIVGLAIGMAAAILILVWVHDEQTFDAFHDRSEDIYRVYQAHSFGDRYLETASTPGILSAIIRERCPELEYVTCIRGYRGEQIVTVGDQIFNEKGLGFADEFFFSLFSFPLNSGDRETALKEPFSVAISESRAKKYFGDSPAMGRTINIFGADFTVTAIFEDMPGQSHMHFDVIGSFVTYPAFSAPTWGVNTFKTYVKLLGESSVDNVDQKLESIVRDHLFSSPEQYETVIAAGNYKKFVLQPLTDIHLESHLYFEFETNGNKTYVIFFRVIALFILFIAIINYLNLSTARSGDRAREIGLRKTMGSSRLLLILQFLAESVTITLIAFLLSLAAVYILLPYFSDLTGKGWLKTPFESAPGLIPLLSVLAIIIGIIAGLYPAFILSSFKPVSVMGSKGNTGKSGVALRNGLVVFQFFITVVLLVMTLVVNKQMRYIGNEDPGFDPDGVVVVKTFGQVVPKLEVLKRELLSDNLVRSVSASSSVPGTVFTNVGMGLPAKSTTGMNMCIADADFLGLMDIELINGRYFDGSRSFDNGAVVVNESMERFLGEEDLINKSLWMWVGGTRDTMLTIIGIIKDFNYESFHEPVKPLAIVKLNGLCQWPESYLSIRINNNYTAAAIKHIEDCWNRVMPGTPFDYTFLDSVNSNQYQQENLMGTLFLIFTLFMIFVACLGLLGLTSFSVARRNLEIALRKVMGASADRLIVMLTTGFIRWAVIANLLAWPFAWFFMKRWLEQFALRTAIGVWPFILAAGIMLVITSITVIFHTYRASVTNPVISLRCN